jgi:hypothetical protein
MKEIFIYGLVDSLKNELKYIGKSINPETRFRKHLQDSKKKATPKDKWILELRENKQKPELIIIDIVGDENWVFWEQHYISYFKAIGCLLTNSTDGGENPPILKGRKRTEKEIEKIRNSNLGQKRSDEVKKNISDSKKGKPIPWLNNGKKRSLSHRNNLSLSLKGRTSPNKGKKYTTEHLEKLSIAHSHQKKEVIQLNLDGSFVKLWSSISEAKKFYKNNHISECCSGKVKTAAGFIWKYKSEML